MEFSNILRLKRSTMAVKINVPISDPNDASEMTRDACSFVSAPDSNGAFSLVKVAKFGAPHVAAEPVENDRRLPKNRHQFNFGI